MAFSFFGLGRLFKSFTEEDKRLADSIEAITGARPRNLDLYKLAVRHSSVGQPAGNRAEHNERLEYLGDAVLGTIVAHYLFQRYPFKNEGFLTEIRARMVNGDALNELALKISLDKLVKYEGRRKQVHTHRSMYGDAMEALVGAYYLDFGFNACQRFVTEKLLKPHYDLESLVESETNHKSRLIEWSQKNGYKISFDIIKEAGRSHTREFTAQVTLEGQNLATGTGFSKKKAEQSAALKAYDRVNEGRLPEGLRKKAHTPIQRSEDADEVTPSSYREARDGDREGRGRQQRHPRDERASRRNSDRNQEGRPERPERDGEPRSERSNESRHDRGPRLEREPREPRQEREPRSDRSGESRQDRAQQEGRPEREPREPREPRQDRNQDQPRRHGRYSVTNQEQKSQDSSEYETLNPADYIEAPVITPEASAPETPQQERRPSNRPERGPRGDRPERSDRSRRGPRGANNEEQATPQEASLDEGDMATISAMDDFPVQPIVSPKSDSPSDNATSDVLKPEVKVVETYFPELPPLPEPKRKWVNVAKNAASAAAAQRQEAEESAAAPASDESRESSPSLDSWDAEFARVAPQSDPQPETDSPKEDASQDAAAPAPSAGPENPDWVNDAAEEFRNNVLKAEKDFNAAEDTLSLKPDEPGEDKDGPR